MAPFQKPVLLRALKLLGMLGAVLALYPLACLAFFFSGGPDVVGALCMTGLSVLGGLGIWGLRNLMDSRCRRWPLALCRVLRVGAMLLLGVCGALVWNRHVLLLAAGFLLCFFGALQGNRLAAQHYDSVYSRGYLTVAVVLGIFSAGVMWALHFAKGMAVETFSLAVVFFVFFAIYCLCGNQSNIDYVMERRGNSLEQLPGKIRRYNLALMAGILCVVLLGFLFREPLGAFLLWVLELLKQLGGQLLRLLMYLASLFGGGDELQEEAPPPEQGEQGLPPPGESGFDWGTPLFIAALIALAIWKRRQIWRFLANGVHTVLAWLRNLFTGVRVFHPAEELPTEYRDQVESLSRLEGGAEVKRRANVRQWKRACRAYRHLEPGEGRFRKGYALIVEGLALAGVEIPPGDTPLELLNRTGATLPGEAYPQVVEDYQRVRYGQLPLTPGGEEAVEHALEKLSALL